METRRRQMVEFCRWMGRRRKCRAQKRARLLPFIVTIISSVRSFYRDNHAATDPRRWQLRIRFHWAVIGVTIPVELEKWNQKRLQLHKTEAFWLSPTFLRLMKKPFTKEGCTVVSLYKIIFLKIKDQSWEERSKWWMCVSDPTRERSLNQERGLLVPDSCVCWFSRFGKRDPVTEASEAD